jgi:hypothetical protein
LWEKGLWEKGSWQKWSNGRSCGVWESRSTVSAGSSPTGGEVGSQERWWRVQITGLIGCDPPAAEEVVMRPLGMTPGAERDLPFPAIRNGQLGTRSRGDVIGVGVVRRAGG